MRANRDSAVNAVSKRYRRALSGAMLSSAAFDNIDSSASKSSIKVWTAKEEHAKRERIHDVTVMDIYDIKMEKCGFDHSAIVLLDNWLQSLLGQKCFLN